MIAGAAGRLAPPPAPTASPCRPLLTRAGIPSLDAVDPSQPLVLPEMPTPLCGAVRALLDELRRQRGAYLRLRVLRRGDALEPAFFSALIEDRSPLAGMSYVEYLCFLHRQIQNKIN